MEASVKEEPIEFQADPNQVGQMYRQFFTFVKIARLLEILKASRW